VATAASDGIGMGAVLTVRLPAPDAAQTPSMRRAIQARAPEPPLEDTAVISLRGLRVLVVDDEPDVRDMLTMILEGAGVEVTVAGNADDGVEAVTRELPDLIVSDIGMPREDGYSLLRRVRSLPAHRGGHTRALALTAYARPEDVTRTLTAGYQRHVAKPITPSGFLAAVAAVVSSSSVSEAPSLPVAH
jgi:CheY-like chemotaxis protein